ncbi:LmeA family phospholipid-binding protein [Roseofilum casamattae]|uniref:DUF2993 domain-containing protein n=1 Tax=Roseofilum casamattae BLCC-M143 TaxID=3022442 RepID=A0ABT7BW08_9CYAN|nr:DUF2993 domain-containing protein [Roseofilum casamattae]MDJ1183375.1 DUF2993 domain-containing protein [Roseofilum casamattae BLCC-M143]
MGSFKLERIIGIQDMEGLTIILSSLLLLGSPAGLFAEQVGQSLLKSPFDRVETLKIRVDNAPTHRLLQGQAERVRIAGRGLWITPTFRLAAVDIETDAVDVNWQGDREPFSALDRPLQGGVRLVFSQEDINQWLRSPAVDKFLSNFGFNALPGGAAERFEGYRFANPNIDFQDNRVRLRVTLQQQMPEEGTEPFELAVVVESGIEIIQGWGLALVDPEISLNGNSVSALALEPIEEVIRERVDLRSLDRTPILLRFLQLNITPTQLEIAGFVRIEPPLSSSDRPDLEEES